MIFSNKIQAFFLAMLLCVVSYEAAHANSISTIPGFCTQTNECLREWQFESIANGAYIQTGSSNGPPGQAPYVVGIDADDNVFRNFLVFNIDQFIEFSATTRLIAQVAIQKSNVFSLGPVQADRLHLFGPNQLGSDQKKFVDDLLKGTDSIGIYECLGGQDSSDKCNSSDDYGVSSQYGIASDGLLNPGDTSAPAFINLTLAAIADMRGAGQSSLDSRLVIGGILEANLNTVDDPVFREVDPNNRETRSLVFPLTGQGLCPTCGATIYVAEIQRDSQGPPPGDIIPEPSTMLLFGSGLVGLGLWRYRKRVNA